VALAGTLTPAALFFVGAADLDQVKTWMLAATVAWFIAAACRQQGIGFFPYLHLLRWPTETLTLPPIAPRVVKHSVLTGGEATVKQTSTGIEVSVPAADRDPLDTIVKLELDANDPRTSP
jgi:hypothetical protein